MYTLSPNCKSQLLLPISRVCMAQTKQGERTAITEPQKLSLKALFDKGMTRVGSPLISTAVAETGLPQHVIENWIGNYRRVLHPARNTLTKPKLHTRELSAYNLFCRDLLRNKGNLPACSKAISMDAIPVMVHKVQDLFNQKYKEAGGAGRLPYQSLAAGKVAVDATGLPNDLPLKKNMSFGHGRQQLAAILEHGTGLSFKIRSDQSATVCSLEESAVTLQSICSDGLTPEAACNSEDSGPGTSAGESHAEKTAVEILEAMCVDDSQLAAADCHTEETAVEIVEAMCVDDASSLCCICRKAEKCHQKVALLVTVHSVSSVVSHTLHVILKETCYLCQCK
ncbi:uncharacterized protein LOC125780681 [Astyanax mexicanus]|uniref:uncharacterized protein LOC125780681 n=1 Tax=Astyanax mexicanus TaxID=7994 RepID=UPI0020CAB35D|nr:uncharacterized protein LOC125780681 [Astyanax mexicanus]